MTAITIGTSPTLITTTGHGQSLVLKNVGSVVVYLDRSPSVTADISQTGGFQLLSGEFIMFPPRTNTQWEGSGVVETWYGIVASGITVICFLAG